MWVDMSGLSSSPSLLPMSWAALSTVHPSVVVQQVCSAFQRWESVPLFSDQHEEQVKEDHQPVAVLG